MDLIDFNRILAPSSTYIKQSMFSFQAAKESSSRIKLEDKLPDSINH